MSQIQPSNVQIFHKSFVQMLQRSQNSMDPNMDNVA